MIVATTETLPNAEVVEVLGIARGNVIRAKHIGTDIVAALRRIVGGEVTEYTKLMGEAREQAMDRMMQNGHEMGADAILTVRMTTSTITAGAAEILAYGTAVRIKRATPSDTKPGAGS